MAFSSGVDSTFLLRVAHEELGERVVAATIRSHTFPKRELDEAAAFCRAEGVRHKIIDSEELVRVYFILLSSCRSGSNSTAFGFIMDGVVDELT